MTSSLRWQAAIGLLLALLFLLPQASHAQDDGGKEKKEKPEKVKKEKPEKEKKEKPEKEKKEKPEKEKKAKAGDDDGDDGADSDTGDDEGGRKKKKKKKGDEDESGSTDKGDGANTANESFHQNDKAGDVKHGRAVPCARYRRGNMEFIDKNSEFVYIKRTSKREIYSNQNRGIRALKVRKLTRDQKIDKSKAKTKTDRHGKIKDDGNKLVFKIEWTEDCRYTLTFKRSKKPTRFEKGWKMECVVTKCYEDYYDCDCDMHDIIQYSAIRKTLTKQELIAKQKEAYDDSVSKANALAAVAAEQQAAIDEEKKRKAVEDEVFGPIKRIEGGNISEPEDDPANPGEQPGDNKRAKPEGGDPEKPEKSKPDKAPGADPAKEKPEKGKKGDDSPQPGPESKGKPEKEPKEKADKGDKAPKEKTDKVPKEKKAKEPKQKKEKAPKEPKAPKEKKEKPPKEPKEKKEKPAEDEE